MAVLAFFSWGFIKDTTTNIRSYIQNKPRMDRAAVEKQMKKDGTMKADGTISVDKDFDTEFNAILKELNSLDAEADVQLTVTPEDK
jgi:hypothetical protein